MLHAAEATAGKDTMTLRRKNTQARMSEALPATDQQTHDAMSE
jgi:hypothetical protein